MSNKLAIVIPAFKSEYFHAALESISKQSCKDFTLYIGDDASPYNLMAIADQFRDNTELVYHRFTENTGLIDLAKQWDQCVGLTENEEYIWLFSDDDLMPENAVELFYKTIDQGKEFDLYRFNIRQIDKNGLFISEPTTHPETESAEDFIYRRLKGETLSSVSEYIFSRKVYNRTGGFVHFPLAWCTDDASWYLFGNQSGIFTIAGNPVCWRISEINLSAPGKNKEEKYRATLLFLNWLKLQNVPGRVPELLPYSLRRQSIILQVNFFLFMKNLIEISKLLGSVETIIMSWYMFKQQINTIRGNTIYRNHKNKRK